MTALVNARAARDDAEDQLMTYILQDIGQGVPLASITDRRELRRLVLLCVIFSNDVRKLERGWSL